jgi:hypothetical protein
MLEGGTERNRLASTLQEAYARGLLSEETFSARMSRVLRAGALDIEQLIGDVDFRGDRGGLRARVSESMRTMTCRLDEFFAAEPSQLLALDWTLADQQLILGRDGGSDVVLDDVSVSRRHARIWSHNGRWALQDLRSRNGTTVNGRRVGRCQLRPGDLLTLGDTRLRVD